MKTFFIMTSKESMVYHLDKNDMPTTPVEVKAKNLNEAMDRLSSLNYVKQLCKKDSELFQHILFKRYKLV